MRRDVGGLPENEEGAGWNPRLPWRECLSVAYLRYDAALDATSALVTSSM